MVSGAKPKLAQNANPLAKPGRMPPLRSSTVLAQVCPDGVSETFAGLPVTKPVPSAGSSDCTCAPYVGVYAWPAASVIGNWIAVPVSAAAVTFASVK